MDKNNQGKMFLNRTGKFTIRFKLHKFDIIFLNILFTIENFE